MSTAEKVKFIRNAGWDVKEMLPGKWKIEEPYSEEHWDPVFLYDGERALDVAVAIIKSRQGK